MTPKVTFGIIALNAQPFLEYNLRALYPFAHQIIVVEGAVRAAASLAQPNGHSNDDTLEMLKRFQKEEDPEKKLQTVYAKDEGHEDGFWPEKLQMSQAYAKRATGEWLWQVDSDEFYLEKDMRSVLNTLEQEPDITAMSFRYQEFFGGFDYITVGKWQLVEYPFVHRVFKWGRGYQYIEHRPATILDSEGRDLRSINWRVPKDGSGEDIYLKHYSYVLPKQAEQKVGYYSNVDWTEAFRENQRWLEESYWGLKNPFFLGEKGWPILQWLERYDGLQPEQVHRLQVMLERGLGGAELRPTQDLEHLISSPSYWLLTRLLRLLMPLYWHIRRGLFPNSY